MKAGEGGRKRGEKDERDSEGKGVNEKREGGWRILKGGRRRGRNEREIKEGVGGRRRGR